MGGSESKPAATNVAKSVTVDEDQVAQLQAQTRFDSVEVAELYKTFQKVSDGKPLDRAGFAKGLGMLTEAGLNNLDGSPFAGRMFDLLDINGDGVVDLQEFVTGLSCLCKGSPEEKLRLSFQAYDLDGNGYITKDELADMFRNAWISGFRALSASHSNDQLSQEDLVAFASEMSTLFADSAFESLDANDDGKLSFEEFKEFALAEPKITATLNGFKQEVSITLLS